MASFIFLKIINHNNTPQISFLTRSSPVTFQFPQQRNVAEELLLIRNTYSRLNQIENISKLYGYNGTQQKR